MFFSSKQSLLNTVVLTGGPGGGKSSLIKEIMNFRWDSFQPIILEEAIYTMRGCGLNPRTEEFQRLLVKRQIEREEAAIQEAQAKGLRLILSHRGTLDPCAFWQSFGNTRESFFEMTSMTLEDHYRRYDLVLHLESTAVRIPEAYQKWPVAHRPESIEEATQLDALLGELWKGHPNYVFIPGMSSIEDKMAVAIKTIREFINF